MKLAAFGLAIILSVLLAWHVGDRVRGYPFARTGGLLWVAWALSILALVLWATFGLA